MMRQGTVRGYTAGAYARSHGVVTFADSSGDERIVLSYGAYKTKDGGTKRDNGISSISADENQITISAWDGKHTMTIDELLALYAASKTRLKK